MPRLNKKNIDRKTNKPSLDIVESIRGDRVLDRSMQTRRDDDVIRSPKRTLYDVDYAIKWYVENEIQPQIKAQQTIISVPVIYANGEKWDNVQRLGYLRDEKGMLQSPLIMLKRSSVAERDSFKTLDVNWPQAGNQIVYRQRYNEKNRYEDELFPIPLQQPQSSQQVMIVDIPKYVTVEYEMLVWCDFTTQLNELVDQIFTYSRFAWGNESNKFATTIGSISFETVNTVGEDRLVRATLPLTVQATLLSGQEARISTLKKMYSVKRVTFDIVVDVEQNIFESIALPTAILQQQANIFSGGQVVANTPSGAVTINAQVMSYLTELTEEIATYSNATTITIPALAAVNPVTFAVASKNEFDVFINGQYVDKIVYTWTPSDVTSQTIVFDTAELGYTLSASDVIVVKGRWA
jgi:hypothetical protein